MVDFGPLPVAPRSLKIQNDSMRVGFRWPRYDF
jgi:hypothetical protein